MAEYHQHEAKCWERYEPCCEHHAHSYSCGDGKLGPDCPEYVPPTHKAKLERQHLEFAFAWLEDRRLHPPFYERHRLPVIAYAQGCADHEERTRGRTLEEVAAVAGAAGNSPDLLAFAVALRDGSWETQVTETPRTATPEDG